MSAETGQIAVRVEGDQLYGRDSVDAKGPLAAFAYWRSIQDWAQAFNIGRERNFEQVTPTLRAFQSGEDGSEAWTSLRVGICQAVRVLQAVLAQDGVNIKTMSGL